MTVRCLAVIDGFVTILPFEAWRALTSEVVIVRLAFPMGALDIRAKVRLMVAEETRIAEVTLAHRSIGKGLT